MKKMWILKIKYFLIPALAKFLSEHTVVNTLKAIFLESICYAMLNPYTHRSYWYFCVSGCSRPVFFSFFISCVPESPGSEVGYCTSHKIGKWKMFLAISTVQNGSQEVLSLSFQLLPWQKRAIIWLRLGSNFKIMGKISQSLIKTKHRNIHINLQNLYLNKVLTNIFIQTSEVIHVTVLLLTSPINILAQTLQFNNFAKHICTAIVCTYHNLCFHAVTLWNISEKYKGVSKHLGPLLLTWFNFNPSMDKWLQAWLSVGWNYLSIPKLQRLHRWSLGMYK